MKKTSKALLLMLCAVLLVAASVLGTMAYLTSTDSVENTFTVGNVKITLDEAKVGTDGKALTGNDAARVKANDYHLLPGGTYDKDPTVHIQPKSEKSYVRLLVTITNYTDAAQVLDKTDRGVILLENYVDESADWTHVAAGYKQDTTKDTATYEFRYKETVSNSSTTDVVNLPALFTKITIPGSLTNDQIAKLDGVKINVVAQAIQADGFANADAAWGAFAG